MPSHTATASDDEDDDAPVAAALLLAVAAGLAHVSQSGLPRRLARWQTQASPTGSRAMRPSGELQAACSLRRCMCDWQGWQLDCCESGMLTDAVAARLDNAA
jgi:hypothetical protein